jgi:hypothetical protein
VPEALGDFAEGSSPSSNGVVVCIEDHVDAESRLTPAMDWVADDFVLNGLVSDVGCECRKDVSVEWITVRSFSRHWDRRDFDSRDAGLTLTCKIAKATSLCIAIL